MSTPIPAPPAPPASPVEALGNLILKVGLVAILAVGTYWKLAPGSGSPAPGPVVAHEAAVVTLGQSYAKALVLGSAASLEAGATATWANAIDAKAANQAAFTAALKAAGDPVARELARRFGPATKDALDPTRDAGLRKFFVDLAAGERQAVK